MCAMIITRNNIYVDDYALRIPLADLMNALMLGIWKCVLYSKNLFFKPGIYMIVS